MSACLPIRSRVGAVAFIILLASLGACQTSGDKSPEAKQQALLDTQKALARNALDMGKPNQAMAGLRPLLREYPNDQELLTLMGLTQLALHNGMRAVRFFQTAYKIDPSVANGLNLSSAYIDAGDHERAAQLLTSLAKQAEGDDYPYKERIYHNLGYCYVKQNRLSKAEQWLRQAFEENPSYFPAQLELARLYERTKRPAMALKAYRESIDHCGVCFEPVEALAMLYVKMGKRADASRLLMQFNKIDGIEAGDRAKASALLNRITMADLAPRRGA